ncbi:MAG: VWA domain-containing protein [bacterium]
MKLLSPYFLLLAPVVLGCLYILLKKKEISPVFHSRTALFEKLRLTNRALNLYPYISFAVILLIFAALLRPAKGTARREEVKNARDIFLVIDTSMSMDAIDIKPSRISVAKKESRSFVENRLHDRIGVVIFGGVAAIRCPLTFDHTSVADIIDEIHSGMTGEDGTAIGDGISVAVKHLASSAAKTKIIVLVTDGANNRGVIEPALAAELAKNLNIKIYSVGAGKKGPAMVPVNDPVFGQRFVRIGDELNEDLLKQLADTTGGKYFRATSAKELAEIYSGIDKLEKTKILSSSFVEYNELAPALTSAAFILFIAGLAVRFVVLRRIP